MREIEFRGKRLDNGEWVYGSLIVAYGAWIKDGADKFTNPRRMDMGNKNADFRCVEVNPITVGQFTGLYDKFGEKIWEGDILEFEVFEKTHRTEPVGWKHEFSFFGAGIALNEVLPEDLWVDDYEGNPVYKVIGNVHDNRDC